MTNLLNYENIMDRAGDLFTEADKKNPFLDVKDEQAFEAIKSTFINRAVINYVCEHLLDQGPFSPKNVDSEFVVFLFKHKVSSIHEILSIPFVGFKQYWGYDINPLIHHRLQAINHWYGATIQEGPYYDELYMFSKFLRNNLFTYMTTDFAPAQVPQVQVTTAMQQGGTQMTTT